MGNPERRLLIKGVIRAMARIVEIKTRLRNWLLSNSPMWRRYEIARNMDFLREVVGLIQSRKLTCLVTGGFAYDAVAGTISRPHADVDITFLEKDEDQVFSAFQAAGFSLEKSSAYKTVARRQAGPHVDLLSWKEFKKGVVQHVARKEVIVRVPEGFVAREQEVRLNGLTFKVPCNEYLKSTAPFADSDVSRALLEALPVETPLHCTTSKLHIIELAVDFAVYEYSSAG
jgi:hypothetical protein